VRWQPKIGNSIGELRQDLGLTQDKFGAKLGVTLPTVNRWENNWGKPSPVAMEKIEGMLRSAVLAHSASLLHSPSVPFCELSSSLLNKYFPEEEHRP
jgi:transcriptional regulator with XRE-family HTH domain